MEGSAGILSVCFGEAVGHTRPRVGREFGQLKLAQSQKQGETDALLAVALGVSLDFSDASVHDLSRAFNPARRDRLLASNDLADAVIHGAAYVGTCIALNHGGVWAVRRPLWESLVRLESRAGTAELAVFHWLVKSLADDAPASDAEVGEAARANADLPPGEQTTVVALSAEQRTNSASR